MRKLLLASAALMIGIAPLAAEEVTITTTHEAPPPPPPPAVVIEHHAPAPPPPPVVVEKRSSSIEGPGCETKTVRKEDENGSKTVKRTNC